MLNATRRIGQNTSVLLGVNIITAGAGFMLAVTLGRSLGDDGFGQYTLIMSWLLSLLIFSEFGLSTVLTRDIAAAPHLTTAYLTNSLAAKLLFGLPSALLLLLLASQLTPTEDPEMVTAYRFGVVFLYSGLGYGSFTAIFKAHQVMTPIFWTTLGGQTVLLGGTFALVWLRRPVADIVLWAGLSQTFQLWLAVFFYHRLSLGQSLSRSDVGWASLLQLTRRAWPFALAGFLAALQLRANLMILAYLHSDQALGQYSAAGRFIDAGKQLPGAFYTAILPALAAMAGQPDQSKLLRQTLWRAQVGLLAFALIAAAGALLLAEPLIILTYGPIYRPAIFILQILALTLIPATQNSLLIVYLYATGDERFVNLMIIAHIGLNLGGCFWLIPNWGAQGAAWALLISETVVYLGYRWRATLMQT